jgi:hypothetical protein
MLGIRRWTIETNKHGAMGITAPMASNETAQGAGC